MDNRTNTITLLHVQKRTVQTVVYLQQHGGGSIAGSGIVINILESVAKYQRGRIFTSM